MWIRRRRKIVGAVLLAIVALLLLNRTLSHSAAPAPSWNGITPAVTTRAEVRALLGEPDTKWLCDLPNEGLETEQQVMACLSKFWVLNYGYYHEEIPDLTNIFHQIHFDRHNTVEYVVEITWPNPDALQMTVEDVVAAYGHPEQVLWSRRDFFARGLLYCQQGLIIHADEYRVTERVYFVPIGTEECIKRFFNEIALGNPAPDSHVERALDPWGFNDSTLQEE